MITQTVSVSAMTNTEVILALPKIPNNPVASLLYDAGVSSYGLTPQQLETARNLVGKYLLDKEKHVSRQ